MPTPPYAKVLVSRNGGAATGGAITCVAGDSIQLVPESTVSITQWRWEIFSYPEGFTAPAGWSTAADGTIYYEAVTPPAFVLSSTYWGKYLFKLHVQGGATSANAFLSDKTAGLDLRSPNGLEDTAWLEGSLYATTKRWVRSLQRTYRTIDSLFTNAVAQGIDWSRGTAGSGKGLERNLFDVFTTTNATPLDALSYTLPTSSKVKCVLLVHAVDTAAGEDGRTFWKGDSWRRIGAAAPTRPGGLGASVDLGTDAADAGAATWACDFNVTGNIVSVRVTGEAGKTVRWAVRLQVLSLEKTG